MNTNALIDRIRTLIQKDVGKRGLDSDPQTNLFNAFPGDLHQACRSLWECPQAVVAILTGFFIPQAQPPCGETDGPLGAVTLARVLATLGRRVVLASDAFCLRALEVGLETCGLHQKVEVIALPPPQSAVDMSEEDYWQYFIRRAGPVTHLIALERVGPSHTLESLAGQPGALPGDVSDYQNEVPVKHHDRCHSMRGRDITSSMSPAHLLFEVARRRTPPLTTIGIGDGGNEIGMGKIPWRIIRGNIPQGGLIACRVPVDRLIVAGISNWGAYGLAAGTLLVCEPRLLPDLFQVELERQLLKIMVAQGPLVDGVTAQAAESVDGLPFEEYARPLALLACLESNC